MSRTTKILVTAQLWRFISSYPMLFGALIALLVFLGMIAVDAWFPGVSEGWKRNNANVRSVFFTVAFFSLWISRVWQWRQRNTSVFWASVGIFLLLHALGVFLYSVRVHPLSLKEWIYLMGFESFALIFGIDWLTKRFEHVHTHAHDEGPSRHPSGRSANT